MRRIVDMPRLFMRVGAVDWSIDWRGKSTGSDMGGGDQVVVDGFPRFIGALPMVVPRAMIGDYRAIIAQLRGRVNALRVPMIDPVSMRAGGSAWRDQWHAWTNGIYIEPRPKVTAVAASVAGGSAVTVDERPLRRPIPVGAYLSFDDWPFMVVGRSGPESARVLAVERLAVAVPLGGEIDLAARGIFSLDDTLSGQGAYGLTQAGAYTLPLTEWITR